MTLREFQLWLEARSAYPLVSRRGALWLVRISRGYDYTERFGDSMEDAVRKAMAAWDEWQRGAA